MLATTDRTKFTAGAIQRTSQGPLRLGGLNAVTPVQHRADKPQHHRHPYQSRRCIDSLIPTQGVQTNSSEGNGEDPKPSNLPSFWGFQKTERFLRLKPRPKVPHSAPKPAQVKSTQQHQSGHGGAWAWTLAPWGHEVAKSICNPRHRKKPIFMGIMRACGGDNVGAMPFKSWGFPVFHPQAISRSRSHSQSQNQDQTNGLTVSGQQAIFHISFLMALVHSLLFVLFNLFLRFLWALDFRNFFHSPNPHHTPRVARKRRAAPGAQLEAWSNLHPPHGWQSIRCPAPVTQNDVPDFKMPQMPHACHEKWTWLKKGAPRTGKGSPSETNKTGGHGRPTLRTSAQSKCTRTFSKGSFMRGAGVKSRRPHQAPWSNPGLLLLP